MLNNFNNINYNNKPLSKKRSRISIIDEDEDDEIDSNNLNNRDNNNNNNNNHNINNNTSTTNNNGNSDSNNNNNGNNNSNNKLEEYIICPVCQNNYHKDEIQNHISLELDNLEKGIIFNKNNSTNINNSNSNNSHNNNSNNNNNNNKLNIIQKYLLSKNNNDISSSNNNNNNKSNIKTPPPSIPPKLSLQSIATKTISSFKNSLNVKRKEINSKNNNPQQQKQTKQHITSPPSPLPQQQPPPPLPKSKDNSQSNNSDILFIFKCNNINIGNKNYIIKDEEIQFYINHLKIPILKRNSSDNITSFEISYSKIESLLVKLENNEYSLSIKVLSFSIYLGPISKRNTNETFQFNSIQGSFPNIFQESFKLIGVLQLCTFIKNGVKISFQNDDIEEIDEQEFIKPLKRSNSGNSNLFNNNNSNHHNDNISNNNNLNNLLKQRLNEVSNKTTTATTTATAAAANIEIINDSIENTQSSDNSKNNNNNFKKSNNLTESIDSTQFSSSNRDKDSIQNTPNSQINNNNNNSSGGNNFFDDIVSTQFSQQNIDYQLQQHQQARNNKISNSNPALEEIIEIDDKEFEEKGSLWNQFINKNANVPISKSFEHLFESPKLKINNNINSIYNNNLNKNIQLSFIGGPKINTNNFNNNSNTRYNNRYNSNRNNNTNNNNQRYKKSKNKYQKKNYKNNSNTNNNDGNEYDDNDNQENGQTKYTSGGPYFYSHDSAINDSIRGFSYNDINYESENKISGINDW